jgi:hypothetical protein
MHLVASHAMHVPLHLMHILLHEINENGFNNLNKAKAFMKALSFTFKHLKNIVHVNSSKTICEKMLNLICKIVLP